jgi:ATP phosphoribosyltransferase
MNNMSDLTEKLKAAEKIFLPDRYGESFIVAYQDTTGIEVPEVKDRKAMQVSKRVKFCRIRGRDIPRVVELSRLTDEPTIGLTGSEWYQEFVLSRNGTVKTMAEALESYPLGRVCFLRNDRDEAIQRIFSPYPALAARVLDMNGIKYPSIEDISGAADKMVTILSNTGAVDLVVSANTAKLNNLSVTELLGINVAIVAPLTSEQIAANNAYQLMNSTRC